MRNSPLLGDFAGCSFWSDPPRSLRTRGWLLLASELPRNTRRVKLIPATDAPIRLQIQDVGKDEPLVEFGDGYLMSVRGEGQPYYSVGPIAIQGDGTILSLDSGDRLAK